MNKIQLKLGIFSSSLFLVWGTCLAGSPLEDIITNYTAPLGHREPLTKVIMGGSSSICYLDDSQIFTIENGIFHDIRDSALRSDFGELTKLNFDSMTGVSVSSQPAREMEGIDEYAWLGSGKGSFREHLAQFKNIDYFELKPVDYSVDPGNRSDDGTIKAVTVLAKLDVRGKNAANQLTQDRAKLDISLESVNGAWIIKSVAVAQGLTQIQTRGPAFEDITSRVGLDQVKTYRRTEAIRRGGYALAVIDYNHDGIPDLFVGQKGNAEVWLGSKEGTFHKIATPFDREKFSKSAVFADFSNDGNPGAVITRFLDEAGKPKPTTQVAFYKSIKGVYSEAPPSFGDPSLVNNPMPLAVGDFNGDGLLDVYVGYPGTQDFSVLGSQKQNLLKDYQGLYLNDGKGGFLNNTAALSTFNDNRTFATRLFPHSSLAVDFNQDGKLDLLVLDDRKNLSPAFVNDGHGKYHNDAKKLGLTNWNYAMGISSGDVNNDGWVDLAYTNVNFNADSRIFTSCKRHYARGSQVAPDPGLRVYRSENKAQNFVDVTSALGLEDVGEGAGSVTFLDYNNDGFMDIYVTNGLWSGTPGGQELDSFFATTLYMGKTGGALYNLAPENILRFMDVLSQFQGKIGSYLDKSTVTKSKDRPSLAGFQRNRLFRNNRDGTFSEVGFLEGVDSIADGYIAGKIDFDHDGKTDLVLRNADPGTDDYKYPVIQLYRNKLQTTNKSVSLTFRGTKSNHDAIGLYAIAHAKGWKQVQHLEGNSGAMQQQHFLSYGLGKHQQIDSLEIFWPSGLKQVVKNLKPGWHNITEPNLDLGNKLSRSDTLPAGGRKLSQTN